MGTTRERAQQINDEIERLVLARPTQYLWGYNRYKRPSGARPPPGPEGRSLRLMPSRRLPITSLHPLSPCCPILQRWARFGSFLYTDPAPSKGPLKPERCTPSSASNHNTGSRPEDPHDSPDPKSDRSPTRTSRQFGPSPGNLANQLSGIIPGADRLHARAATATSGSMTIWKICTSGWTKPFYERSPGQLCFL